MTANLALPEILNARSLRPEGNKCVVCLLRAKKACAETLKWKCGHDMQITNLGHSVARLKLL